MNRTTRRAAVLYCRISESDDRSTSLARQEADLRRRATSEGWEVREVLIDDGLSGTKSRANADRARDMLRSGVVDVLAVWAFDRYARTGLGAVADLIEALDARDASGDPALFVAEQNGLRSDQPAWRIIAAVLAEVARMESANTALRVRSSIRRLKQDARWSGGTIPLGYTAADHPTGAGRILTPEPTEARYLTQAAQQVAAGGSFYAAASWLNSTSFRPRRAARWSPQAVERALTGSAIVGRVAVDGEVLLDAHGMPRQTFEPALDLDLWHAVRAAHGGRRAERKIGSRAPRTGDRRPSRMLAGLARCAECSSPLYARQAVQTTAAGEKRVRALYSCSARSNGKECPGVIVTAEPLEEYVAEAFLGLFGSMEVLAPVEIDAPATELVETREALAEVERRLADLDLDDDAEEELLAHRRGLRASLRALRDQAPAAPDVRFDPTGESVRQAWASSTVEERRRMLGEWLDAVLVAKGKRGAHGLDAERVTLVPRHDERIDVDPGEGDSLGPGRGPRRPPRASSGA